MLLAQRLTPKAGGLAMMRGRALSWLCHERLSISEKNIVQKRGLDHHAKPR